MNNKIGDKKVFVEMEGIDKFYLKLNLPEQQE